MIKPSIDHEIINQEEIDTKTIRELNDTFRRTGVGGRFMMTAGVDALGLERVVHLLRRVRSFEQFDAGNDPHGEHDFGSFEDAGERFFWKIDYYDLEMKWGSDNPADAMNTMRVLTVMKADEW